MSRGLGDVYKRQGGTLLPPQTGGEVQRTVGLFKGKKADAELREKRKVKSEKSYSPDLKEKEKRKKGKGKGKSKFENSKSAESR